MVGVAALVRDCDEATVEDSNGGVSSGRGVAVDTGSAADYSFVIISSEDEMSGEESKHRKEAIIEEANPSSFDLRSASGVDRTLIRWFLSLTPLERLRTVENYIASIEKLRNAQRRT